MNLRASWCAAILWSFLLAGCGGGDGATSSGGAGGSSTGGTGGTGGSGGTGGTVDAGEDGASGSAGMSDASPDAEDDAVSDVSNDSTDPDAQDAVSDVGEDVAVDGPEDVAIDTNPCGCLPGEFCHNGVCLPETACQTNADCAFDQTCDQGFCAPWSSVPTSYDPSCVHVAEVGVLAPRARCEFSEAPAGDPFPGHVDVQGTPIVATFDGLLEGPASIAAVFTAIVPSNYTEDLGVIRVISGDDCVLQANLGGGAVTSDFIISSSTLAAADLDGDGLPDLVALTADGGIIAFTLKAGVWSVLWKLPYQAGQVAPPCTASNHRCSLGWAGPSIHDLDDDGVPEVIREGMVVSAAGTLLSLQPAGYASYSQGLFPVMANLDADPFIELTNGARIWEWQSGAWVLEAGFPGTAAAPTGHVALADFGPYGSGPASDPEFATVSNGTVRVQALDGTVAMPATSIAGGTGGPPTVADFDGDGLPEVGVAGSVYYSVFDIDCGPNPRTGGICPSGRCDHLAGPCVSGSYFAWSRRTQDASSNVTGSSVFDFEADGRSEVVYADECFTRVYDGRTGDVIFSQYRSSCTWYENPIIADVDGNFRADLVIPSNKACSPAGAGVACQMLNADGVDVQFNGVRCKEGQDCPSGVCDEGLCRCTTSAECCGAGDDATCIDYGLKCAAPAVGTPGTGNTCRAPHPRGVSGIRVYSDLNDQWVRSRRIWNQHAYHVTHVNEDGTVPATSAWAKNWETPSLNNFRQNVPGTPNMQEIGDPTAGVAKGVACENGEALLVVDVCNRGSGPMGAGVAVGFYVDGSPVCSAVTSKALYPGLCEQVTCVWPTPPTSQSEAVDVDVIANDGQSLTECQGANNAGLVHEVYCP